MLGEFSDEEDVPVREDPRLAPWSLPARWWAAIGGERPIVSEACSSGTMALVISRLSSHPRWMSTARSTCVCPVEEFGTGGGSEPC